MRKLRIVIYEKGQTVEIREVDPDKVTPRQLAKYMDAGRLAKLALGERVSVSVDVDFIG